MLLKGNFLILLMSALIKTILKIIGTFWNLVSQVTKNLIMCQKLTITGHIFTKALHQDTYPKLIGNLNRVTTWPILIKNSLVTIKHPTSKRKTVYGTTYITNSLILTMKLPIVILKKSFFTGTICKLKCLISNTSLHIKSMELRITGLT